MDFDGARTFFPVAGALWRDIPERSSTGSRQKTAFFAETENCTDFMAADSFQGIFPEKNIFFPVTVDKAILSLQYTPELFFSIVPARILLI
jgi:hypothetical protein